MRKFILVVFFVLAAVSVPASAAVFRFHDYQESPDIVWLTVGSIQVTGNGAYGSGTISNFVVNQLYQDVGERISFDYQLAAFGSTPGIVYTRLLGASDEPGLISDEFLLWATDTSGLYHVDFISYDSFDGRMGIEHSNMTLPTPTAFVELPEWQLVGTIDMVGDGTIDTFYAMSPEPATLILLGLGGLALLRRKR